MNTSKLKEILSKRKSLDLNDDYSIYDCWTKEINILSENIQETITFLKNECTDEEFYWLSEIFEDIAYNTQSKEFINCIKNRLNRISDKNLIESIKTDIEFAESNIK